MLNKNLPHEWPKALQQHLPENASQYPGVGMARRGFIKLLGVGSFALGAYPLITQAQDNPTEPAALKPTQRPSAFVKIDLDGTVTVTINRLDFGQGVQTGLPMILAEELDADWSKVRSVHGSNDPAYVDPVSGMHITGGSSAIRNSYTQYRELGARARAMLIAAAAEKWAVEASELRTEAGVVIASDGRRAGYGELAEAAMTMPVPASVPLKDPKTFRIIGQPTTRLDAVSKSSGQQPYGIDVRLPGQLTAVVARPPVFGAKLVSVDDQAALTVPGVKKVLRVPMSQDLEVVAVIADGYWPARQAREALKLAWDSGAVERVDSSRLLRTYRELAAKPGSLYFDADLSALGQGPRHINAEYVFPYLAHAPMEPLNCTVQFDAQGAELWVGTQFPGRDGEAAAKVLGLKPEQVRVRVQMAGGGFGRRATGGSELVVEACLVARAAKNAGIDSPIRTLWSREDDIRGGFYRPMHVHKARIDFDQQGKVLAWDHVIVGQSIASGTPFEDWLIKKGVDESMVEGMREPYTLPMRLSVHHPRVNVPVLWWRSVGSTHTAFVMETLIDEIAQATRQDPVSYRMKLFGDEAERHKAALHLAVERSGYGKRKLAAGRSWGVAVHESFKTVVAYIVEASMKDGRPVLHQVTAAVHCNLAVNPRSVEAQIQGAALMGLSTCLPGSAITLKDGVVEQSNFSDYTVARMTDMPKIEVHIVPSAEPPTGLGEPGLPPLAPAFANAVSRLTGKRVRQLPFQTPT